MIAKPLKPNPVSAVPRMTLTPHRQFKAPGAIKPSKIGIIEAGTTGKIGNG